MDAELKARILALLHELDAAKQRTEIAVQMAASALDNAQAGFKEQGALMFRIERVLAEQH